MLFSCCGSSVGALIYPNLERAEVYVEPLPDGGDKVKVKSLVGPDPTKQNGALCGVT